MSKKKAENRYDITRNQYKDIKKMDHQQINDFCSTVFSEGVKFGAKNAEGLTPEETRTVLLSVKGIGEKKAEDIINALLEADRNKKGA